MGHVFPDLPMVPINLWRADAVVLFDWLMTVDLDTVPITHPAQKQALTDLLTRLEQETDILPVTQDEIDAAQADVARDMGWPTPRARPPARLFYRLCRQPLSQQIVSRRR